MIKQLIFLKILVIIVCTVLHVVAQKQVPQYSNYASFGSGYGNVTGDDMVRWLTTMEYCTQGKACAITTTMSCEEAVTNKITTQNIKQSSILLQSHRGSETLATYLLSNNNDFLTLAQENGESSITLFQPDTSPTLLDKKKLIVASSFAAATNADFSVSNGCVPFNRAGTFSISKDKSKEFAFCLDFTEAYASDKNGSCILYGIQTSSFVSQLELYSRIKQKIVNDTVIQFKEQFKNYLTHDVTGCFENTTTAAAAFCAKNNSDSNSSQFLECVEAVEIITCMDYSTIFRNIRNILFVKDENETNNNTFIQELTEDLIQLVGLGANISLYGGYTNANNMINNNNTSGACAVDIGEAVGICSREVLLNSNILTETVLSKMNISRETAALQQSLFYNGLCENGTGAKECVSQIIKRRYTPEQFTRYIGVVKVNTTIISDSAKNRNSKIVSCIVNKMKNLTSCKISNKTKIRRAMDNIATRARRGGKGGANGDSHDSGRETDSDSDSEDDTPEFGTQEYWDTAEARFQLQFQNQMKWFNGILKNKAHDIYQRPGPKPVPQEELDGLKAELSKQTAQKRARMKKSMDRLRQEQQQRQQQKLDKEPIEVVEGNTKEVPTNIFGDNEPTVLSNEMGLELVEFPSGQGGIRLGLTSDLEVQVTTTHGLQEELSTAFDGTSQDIINSVTKFNRASEVGLNNEIKTLQEQQHSGANGDGEDSGFPEEGGLEPPIDDIPEVPVIDIPA